MSTKNCIETLKEGRKLIDMCVLDRGDLYRDFIVKKKSIKDCHI